MLIEVKTFTSNGVQQGLSKFGSRHSSPFFDAYRASGGQQQVKHLQICFFCSTPVPPMLGVRPRSVFTRQQISKFKIAIAISIFQILSVLRTHWEKTVMLITAVGRICGQQLFLPITLGHTASTNECTQLTSGRSSCGAHVKVRLTNNKLKSFWVCTHGRWAPRPQ